MPEAFCVLYKDLRHDPPAKRLSRSYDSLESAINAAFVVAQHEAEPIQIRGTDGTLMEKAELYKALSIAGS